MCQYDRYSLVIIYVVWKTDATGALVTQGKEPACDYFLYILYYESINPMVMFCSFASNAITGRWLCNVINKFKEVVEKTVLFYTRICQFLISFIHYCSFLSTRHILIF